MKEASSKQPSYFGDCPHCGTLLGFGHSPETCEKRVLDPTKEELERLIEASDMLWVVLANVSGGDWKLQSEEWQEAAIRWRDNYFSSLKPFRKVKI